MQDSRQDKLVSLKIGETLKKLRRCQKLSQTEVATECGITFQQYQKYEKGKNRLSVDVLFKICGVINAEVIISPLGIIVKEISYSNLKPAFIVPSGVGNDLVDANELRRLRTLK